MGIFCGTACRLAGRESSARKQCTGDLPAGGKHAVFRSAIIIPMRMCAFWLQYLGAGPIFSICLLCRRVWMRNRYCVPQSCIIRSAKCGNRWIRRWLISAIILPRRILLLWPAMGTAFRNNAPAYVCWRIIIMRTEV